jgi:hypothetical protein
VIPAPRQYPRRGLVEARHRRTRQRRSPALWIVPAVLVAVGLVLFLVVNARGGGGGVPGSSQATPSFAFAVTKVVAVPVTPKKAQELEGEAKPVADQVTTTMNSLFTEAFLDPSNWRSGTYDQVWPLFDGGSQAAAEQDGGALTLGTTASDRFKTVDQPTGKVTVKVLMDRDNKAASAVAIVRFQALAAGKDGTTTMIVSTGQFFLHPAADGWRVYAFNVTRDDHSVAPSPGPSSTPSAEAS